MAKLPTTLPQSDIAAVQSAAKKWRDAEKRARDQVYNLLQAIYEFGLKHNANTAALDAWLAGKGLQVDPDKANSWTAACKLAIAEQDNGSWKASDSQVHKYSYVLRLAENEKKKAAEIPQWFKDKSLSIRLQEAYTQFLPPNGNDEKLEKAEEKLSSVWEEAADAKDEVKIKIDLNKAGIDQGRALMPVEVARDGTVTILGIVQPDENIINTDIKRILQEEKSEGGGRVAGPWARLEQMCRFANTIKREERYLIIFNEADKCVGKILRGDRKGTIILNCAQPEMNEELPIGTFVLNVEEQLAFLDMRRNFRNFKWECKKEAQKHRIIISEVDKSFADRIEEITKEREEKAEKAGQNAPNAYELPAGLKSAGKKSYYIPLLTSAQYKDREFASLKTSLEWSNWSIPANRQFRDEMIKQFKEINDTYQKMRIFNKKIEIFKQDDEKPERSVEIVPAMAESPSLWFSVGRDDFTRVFKGFNTAIGKGSASITAANRLLSISGKKGSTTFTADIPDMGFGTSYDVTALYAKEL